MTDREIICEQLMEMGFTALEADIYLFLLTEGVQTGYAIAKGINKPTANVYKALESLSAKGAIEFSVSNKKQYFASDWKQLLKRREAQFSQTLSSLEKNLSELNREQSDDEQVYQITQVDQVFEQSLLLISQAKNKLMVEAEPESVPIFKQALEQAAARGVEIWIKVYEPVELEGVNLILRQRGSEVYGKTNDISFKFAADGNAMLMADITSDQKNVIQAFRSNSALMGMSIYCGLLYEIVLTQLKKSIPSGEFSESQAILERTAHLHPMSTQNEVFQHYKEKYQIKREKE